MFRDGKLTSEQAILPDYLERPTLACMVPGQAYEVDADGVLVDEQHRVWISRDVPLVYGPNDYVSRRVRAICFDEGIVLDVTDCRDEEGNLHQFETDSLDEMIDDPDFDVEVLVPVIEVVASRSGLAAIEQLFQERFGQTLDGMTEREVVFKQGSEETGRGARKSGARRFLPRIARRH